MFKKFQKVQLKNYAIPRTTCSVGNDPQIWWS